MAIMRSSSTVLAWSAAVAIGSLAACAPPIKSTLDGPMSPGIMAQLWVAPPVRPVFFGVGGERLAPNPAARYKVIETKQGGFSPGYDVEDPQGRKWSAKFLPEAQPEVAASRILWAVGYHQPPLYLVSQWDAEGAALPNPQGPARFREKSPDFHGIDEAGNWSYYENPFVGTTPFMGLLVLQVMLGNSDLKDSNNTIYELEETVEGARRWYVARDVGHSFGRTGVTNAPRNHPDVFDETPFILGVENGRVKFDYRGRHRELFADITPAHVAWICERLDRVTDQQWADIFRAAGYGQTVADRYTRRLKQKIAEGLALAD